MEFKSAPDNVNREMGTDRKRAYDKPALNCLGDIRTLTQGGGFNPILDAALTGPIDITS